MFAIVILNHNNARDTLECMATLPACGSIAYRVFVADNASSDGSGQAIAQAYPDAALVFSSTNRGYAGGMNLGIEHARRAGADLCLLLNNDIVLAPDVIDELVEAAEQHPEAGIFVPKIYYYSAPTVIWSAGAEWRRFPPRVTMRGLNRPDGPDFDRPRLLEYATGCALLVRRAVFDQIGLFDESFFMYQEDYDYCYRCRNAGWSIRYVPTAKVWHKVSMGLGSLSARWWYHWSRSTVRLYRHTWGYSWPVVASLLGYFAVREILKGRLRFLPSMLAGVRDEGRVLQAGGFHA